jgi:DNA-binding GntR family transcriptional regulator
MGRDAIGNPRCCRFRVAPDLGYAPHHDGLPGAMMASRCLERPQKSPYKKQAALLSIEARDADAAELAVRRHVQNARETLAKYVMTEAAASTLG